MSGFFVPKPCLGSQLNQGHPLSRGLVGLWLFNEGSGGRVFDLSGNGNTGTFGAGAVSPTWASDKSGPAISFDGGDNISCGTKDPFTTNVFTISFWYYWNGETADNQGMITKYDAWSDAGARWVFYWNKGTNLPIFTNTVANCSFNLYDLVQYSWRHLLLTSNGTNISLYENAKLIQTVAAISLGSKTTAKINIGSFLDGVGGWNGLLDYVMIFNRDLSASEIAQLYRMMLLGTPLIFEDAG